MVPIYVFDFGPGLVVRCAFEFGVGLAVELQAVRQFSVHDFGHVKRSNGPCLTHAAPPTPQQAQQVPATLRVTHLSLQLADLRERAVAPPGATHHTRTSSIGSLFSFAFHF